jgi:predicted enzyme related to lactoylglutathione lyase
MPLRDVAPTGAPNWIELFASDPDATQAFYTELFGWTCEQMGEEFGNYFTFAKDGKRVAGGMKNDGSGGPDGWSVYLQTDDAQAVADAAAAKGGTVIVPAMAVMDLGTMVVLADPGGAAIGGWQPGTHTGFEVHGEPGTPGWFELHTRAYDASIAFYRDVFHWDVHEMSATPEFRYSTYGVDETAEAGIMDASAFLPAGAPSYWAVYFVAESTDAALERVVALGGSVTQTAEDTPYGRLATAADPTGISFKLLQLPT